MQEFSLNGWAEKRNLKPATIAFFSLPIIFILYQGFGVSLLLLYQLIFPGNQVVAMRFSQTLAQYIFLLIPVYILIRFHSSSVRHYVFLNKPDLGIGWILIPASVIVFQPIMQFLSGIERTIPWPEVFIAKREQLELILKTMVNADSIPELIWVIFMAAVTPALCEEFYFRGYFLRNLSRRFSGKSAVVISGLIFGLFHFNPFQLTGLVLMGIYFSFLTWHYQSLWASIIAHFTNNFLVVITFYVSKEQLINVNFDNPNLQIPINMVLLSSALFLIIFSLILGSKSPKPAIQ